MKSDTCWIIGFIAVFLIGVGLGMITAHGIVYQIAYIDCLLDIKNGKPPQFVLVKQWNGEVKWQYNKEYGK